MIKFWNKYSSLFSRTPVIFATFTRYRSMRRVRAPSLCTKSRWQLRHVTKDIWLFANKPRSEASEFHGRDWNLERALWHLQKARPWPRIQLTLRKFPLVYISTHTDSRKTIINDIKIFRIRYNIWRILQYRRPPSIIRQVLACSIRHAYHLRNPRVAHTIVVRRLSGN